LAQRYYLSTTVAVSAATHLGVALIVNELVEPLRLPIVILTVKPVVDKIMPPKY
jgi:hypothetical protein